MGCWVGLSYCVMRVVRSGSVLWCIGGVESLQYIVLESKLDGLDRGDLVSGRLEMFGGLSAVGRVSSYGVLNGVVDVGVIPFERVGVVVCLHLGEGFYGGVKKGVRISCNNCVRYGGYRLNKEDGKRYFVFSVFGARLGALDIDIQIPVAVYAASELSGIDVPLWHSLRLTGRVRQGVSLDV